VWPAEKSDCYIFEVDRRRPKRHDLGAAGQGEPLRVATRSVDRTLLLLLLGAAAYLYFNLFSFPRAAFLLGGDQVFFWLGAQRMLDGEKIYQDFLQFTPPGTDLVYLAFFKAFGLKVWVANAVVLALGVVLCWMCFALATEIMERRFAILAAALYIVLIYGRSLNATHHFFSVLAVLSAVKIGMRSTGVRVLAAGTLLGVASFFTQTHGVAALFGFAVFLVLRQMHAKRAWGDVLRNEALLLFGFMVALLLLSVPVLSVVGWKQLWYFQVTYMRQFVVGSAQGASLGLPEALSWHALPRLAPYLVVYLTLVAVYPVALWRCWRERLNPGFPWEKVALLSMVGMLLLAGVAFSPNWLRIFAISLPGVILLVWLVGQVRGMQRYAIGLMWVCLALVAVRQTRANHLVHSQVAEMPGGRVATTPQSYEKLRWVLLHCRPGEYFLQAPWPGMYLPLHLRNPLFIDQVLPGTGNRPEEIALAIRQLGEKRVPYVLWAPRLDSAEGLAVHTQGNVEDNVEPLREYLHAEYRQVMVFPDGDEIWQRND
jgi:hypothetical protein